MSYKQFEEQFNKDFTSIYDFDELIMDNANATIPYNGRLEADNDIIQYDSYGDEGSTLKRVYYFEDYDIYVEFYGTRQSYSGAEWDGMREVKPVQKIINTFE